MKQASLFDGANDNNTPLANRVRPDTLADFVGQQIPGSEQTGTARNIMDELADKVAGKVLAKLNAQK